MPQFGPSDIRHANALACLDLLRSSHDPLTITDLARRTGLSRPTVEAVVLGLEAQGVVQERSAGSVAFSGGRPARRFGFAASHGLVAGIDAGPRNVRVMVANLKGTVVGRAHTRIEGNPEAAERIEVVHSTIRRAVEETGLEANRLRAACVGVSGILTADGKIGQSFNVPEWNHLDVASLLGDKLGCGVFLENDIKLAALAEHRLGAAQGSESSVFLQVGHRISLALTIGGRIHDGFHRSAGEIGSLRGMRWTPTSVRGQLTWQCAPDAAGVFAKALAGDPVALAEIREFTNQIAPRIATVALTVDPQLIVVGGGLSQSGQLFVDMLRTEVHRLIMLEGPPDVVCSQFGSEGTTLGALALAFKNSSHLLFGFKGVSVPEIVSEDLLQATP